MERELLDDSSCLKCGQFICDLATKKEARLYKINDTKIIEILVHKANTEKDVRKVIIFSYCMIALFDSTALISLKYVDKFFEIFGRVFRWREEKLESELQNCAKNLFDHLYANFPHNFLHYLSNEISEQEIPNISLLITSVGLHPSLIFSDKSSELKAENWRQKDSFLEERFSLPTPMVLHSQYALVKRSQLKESAQVVESSLDFSVIEKQLLSIHSTLTDMQSGNFMPSEKEVDTQNLRTKLLLQKCESLFHKCNQRKTVQHLSGQHRSFIASLTQRVQISENEVLLQEKTEMLNYIERKYTSLQNEFELYKQSHQKVLEEINRKFELALAETKVQQIPRAKEPNKEIASLKASLHEREKK